MKAIEAYQEFLIKVNKNDTNSSVNISKAEFVILYNAQRIFWLMDKIASRQSDIDIHELENLLPKDIPLVKVKDDSNSTHFKLPDNYFKYDSSYSIATKGKCTNRPIVNWLVKPRNVSVLLRDTNNNPSFEYEETICILSEGSLVVFKDDFKINECFLTYYKTPKAIDLAGSITETGMTVDIDPDDLNLEQIQEILNRCALEVVRNYENVEGYQLAQQRIQTEK